jgi:hypothetical protein
MRGLNAVTIQAPKGRLAYWDLVNKEMSPGIQCQGPQNQALTHEKNQECRTGAAGLAATVTGPRR